MSSYSDIDAPLKCILDGLFRIGVVDADDKQVNELIIQKQIAKKGELNNLRVFIDNSEPFKDLFDKPLIL